MCDLEQILFISLGLSAAVYAQVSLIAGPICLGDDIPCYARNLPAHVNERLNCCEYFGGGKGNLMSSKAFLLKQILSRTLKWRLSKRVGSLP